MPQHTTSSDVSVIGLGAMGHALASTLLSRERQVTVYNRTPNKAAALRERGATVAEDARAAVAASPVVIVCVTGYDALYELLAPAELDGKTVVQLSTGTPREAREAERWMRERGALYLDGAILAVPAQIGTSESLILVSGSAEAHARSQALLGLTAGGVVHVGEQVVAAAALDFAVLSHLFGALLGFLHGARICEAEGIPVASLGRLLGDLRPAIAAMIEHEVSRVVAEDYAAPQSSLGMCAEAMAQIARHAEESAIDGELPAYMSRVFARGVAAGLGDHAIGGLMHVLRSTRAPASA